MCAKRNFPAFNELAPLYSAHYAMMILLIHSGLARVVVLHPPGKRIECFGLLFSVAVLSRFHVFRFVRHQSRVSFPRVRPSMSGEKIDLAASSSTWPFCYGLRLGMDVSKEDMPHMQRRGVEAAVDFVRVRPGLAKYVRERSVWDAKLGFACRPEGGPGSHLTAPVSVAPIMERIGPLS